MDPDTFLPRSLRLDTSAPAEAATKAVVAHLMPFSIAYDGPAPMDTYFVMQEPEASEKTFDAYTSTEAVSAFRGRKIHGTRVVLPDTYQLGFFRVREDAPDEADRPPPPSDRERKRASTQTAPPASVRGSRFSLDDDEEEEEDEEENTTYEDSIVPAYEPEAIQAKRGVAWAKECLYPVASAGDSLWVWGPDGPIDAGDDVYIRTCREWLSVIAPAVCPFTHHRYTAYKVKCTFQIQMHSMGRRPHRTYLGGTAV